MGNFIRRYINFWSSDRFERSASSIYSPSDWTSAEKDPCYTRL